MAHKGKTAVVTSLFLSLAEKAGAQVEATTGYLVITKKGDPTRQILVEKNVPKGKLESSSRWVELRGKGKTPYEAKTAGVVPHDHSSPSIKFRLDMDGDEKAILANFALLLNDLLGIKVVEEESKEEATQAEAA